MAGFSRKSQMAFSTVKLDGISVVRAVAGAAILTACAAVHWQPLLAVFVAVALFVGTFALFHSRATQKGFLFVLGVLLAGYAFLGKGLAYLPAPPIFVGEVALGLGLLVLVAGGRPGPALRLPLSWLLVAFAFLGVIRTVPYLDEYGVLALRDAVIWGYAAFAVIVAQLLLEVGWLPRVPRIYGRCVPWFLAWVPIAFLIQLLARDLLPVLSAGSQRVTLPDLKAGDISVHLAGVGAYLLLDLHKISSRGRNVGMVIMQWTCWIGWLVGGFMIAAWNRGGLLAMIAGFVVVLALRPSRGLARVAFLAVVLATASFVFNLEIDVGYSRKFSAEQVAANLKSVVGGSEDSQLEGTRQWRLQWWREIIQYTVFGEHFWLGKGFGINLAYDDRKQATPDAPLRSPHNGHLTVLARMGVPGFALWVLLQGAFAFALLRAHFLARRARQEWWARVNLWILAYWTAFMVNGMFDVFLEGPQGGIWFWSLFGFGIAALGMQKRDRKSWGVAQASPTRT